MHLRSSGAPEGGTMNERVNETVSLIVKWEVRLAAEREYSPLNDDGRYRRILTPIVAAVVDHITLPSKELASRFCAKIRAAEVLRTRRDDLLPETFVDSMRRAGHLADTDDAIAAVLLMKDFAALQPGEIPASLGERHFFDTVDEVVEFFEKFDRWETCELVTRLSTGGEYCIDVETT
jgi:hypothetical protein